MTFPKSPPPWRTQAERRPPRAAPSWHLRHLNGWFATGTGSQSQDVGKRPMEKRWTPPMKSLWKASFWCGLTHVETTWQCWNMLDIVGHIVKHLQTEDSWWLWGKETGGNNDGVYQIKKGQAFPWKILSRLKQVWEQTMNDCSNWCFGIARDHHHWVSPDIPNHPNRRLT